jgi:carbonic anhydrase
VTLFDELLEANASYAQTFPGTELTAMPSRHIVILTCMDARIDNFDAFGLAVGDAHILRNAGGRVTDDVIRSLLLSSDVLGTRYVAIIHHTQCGLWGTTNEAIQQRVRDDRDVDASAIDFRPFQDADESVRDDLARLAASPLLRKDITTAGFVYDVANGRMRPVASAEGNVSPSIARAIEEFRANAGQLGGEYEDVPVLLLHATDADSNTERVTPLTCQPRGDSWAVFASKAGASSDPYWYLNLVAKPQVTIEFGAETIEVTARVVEGAERDEIWEAQKQASPQFARYEASTDRVIPVVVLERR